MIDLLDSPIIVQSFEVGPTMTYRFLPSSILRDSVHSCHFNPSSPTLSSYVLPASTFLSAALRTAAISVSSWSRVKEILWFWWFRAVCFRRIWDFVVCLIVDFQRCLGLSIGLPGRVSHSDLIFFFFSLLSFPFLRLDFRCCVFSYPSWSCFLGYFYILGTNKVSFWWFYRLRYCIFHDLILLLPSSPFFEKV